MNSIKSEQAHFCHSEERGILERTLKKNPVN